MKLRLALSLAFPLLLTVAPAATPRPNILLILPDQMRASAMACDGNGDVQTPNIDRLAADGVMFKRTYANVPVCWPPLPPRDFLHAR